MRAFRTAQCLRALSRATPCRSFPASNVNVVHRTINGVPRNLCSNSGGSERDGPPKLPPQKEGYLARLLSAPDGEQNRLLAALGYYSTESQAIGAGNTLYKQALARASAAVAVEAGVGNTEDFGPQFEMLSIHIYLTLRRLREEKGSPYEAEVKTVMQCIFDIFWTDVRSRMMIEERGMKLIESAKWIKDCEQRFFGMALSFDEAWDNHDKFREAVRRNVTCLNAENERVDRFHRYMARERARLEKHTVKEIWDGICWDDKYPAAQSA